MYPSSYRTSYRYFAGFQAAVAMPAFFWRTITAWFRNSPAIQGILELSGREQEAFRSWWHLMVEVIEEVNAPVYFHADNRPDFARLFASVDVVGSIRVQFLAEDDEDLPLRCDYIRRHYRSDLIFTYPSGLIPSISGSAATRDIIPEGAASGPVAEENYYPAVLAWLASDRSGPRPRVICFCGEEVVVEEGNLQVDNGHREPSAVLGCGHIFGKAYLDEWKAHRPVCPHCRAPIS